MSRKKVTTKSKKQKQEGSIKDGIRNGLNWLDILDMDFTDYSGSREI
ncbi:MAG: hypothetical protein M1404_06770 [Acidobacteria bacterium]|nr:hypothetical protein [Acidobacteriota bacterium]